MTIDQIQAFITVAEQLNYSKAAEILFLSQPNLSRMIIALETELNMQLFIRGSHSVRLSPAGLVLYREFSEVYKKIKVGISKAKDAQLGLSGKVSIGILDGTDVSDFMPALISCFKEKYPNIQISLNSYSFKDLIDKLYDESVDLAFTLEFNLDVYPNLVYEVLEDTKDNLVVHRASPLYEKDTLSIQDMDGQDLIVISSEDFSLITEAVLKELQRVHVAPIIHFAPNLRTAMLWAESGIGAVFLFSRNRMASNPDVKFFNIDSPWKTSFIVGWNKNNFNASLPIVLEYCLQNIKNV